MICCMYMILISLLFGIFVRIFLLNLHLFKEVHIWVFFFPFITHFFGEPHTNQTESLPMRKLPKQY